MKPLAFLLRLLLTGKLALAGAGAAAEAAVEGGKSLTWSVETILADPSRIDIHDSRFIEFCRENRDRLAPGLKAKISKQSPAVRVRISELLLHLGDEEGTALLLEGLESRSGDSRHRTLVALSLLPWKQGQGLTVPLDEQRALAALLPFLDDDQPRFRSLAADALFRLSVPAAVERQKALLEHPDAELRKRAAFQRATYQQDPAAWPVLRDLLAEAQPGDRYRLVNAMADLCGSDDVAVRDEILRAVSTEIERQLDKTDNEASNEVLNLLRCYERARTPREAEILERVLASSLEDWVRGVALVRLSRIEGMAGVGRLMAALEDETLQPEALRALGEQGAEIAAPALIEKVREIFDQTDKQHVRGRALDALVGMGAGQDPAIRRHLDALDPVRRFEAAATLRNTPAEEMLRALTAAALASAEATDAAEDFRAAWQEGSKWEATLRLLYGSGRLDGFDTEDATVPPNYIGLLHGFAEIAKPDVVISEIGMRPEIEDDRHEVFLRLDGRPLEILVADRGDWIDLSRLMAGLNGGLEETGSGLRFVVLYTGDQTAIVTFGDGVKIQDLVRDYAFPLADDPDESMRAGQAYERQVIQQREGQD